MLPAARLPCPFWFASIAHRIGAGPGSGPFAPLLSCSTAYTLSRRSPAAPACQLFYGIGGQLPILLEQSKSRQRLPGGLADILIRILQAVVQRLNDPASQVAVLKPLRDLAQDLRGRPADIRVHIPERLDKGIHHPRGVRKTRPDLAQGCRGSPADILIPERFDKGIHHPRGVRKTRPDHAQGPHGIPADSPIPILERLQKGIHHPRGVRKTRRHLAQGCRGSPADKPFRILERLQKGIYHPRGVRKTRPNLAQYGNRSLTDPRLFVIDGGEQRLPPVLIRRGNSRQTLLKMLDLLAAVRFNAPQPERPALLHGLLIKLPPLRLDLPPHAPTSVRNASSPRDAAPASSGERRSRNPLHPQYTTGPTAAQPIPRHPHKSQNYPMHGDRHRGSIIQRGRVKTAPCRLPRNQSQQT